MSEHLHPWALLHAQEEPNRRRRSNVRGRYALHAPFGALVFVEKRNANGNSRQQRLHYHRGNFSVKPGPHSSTRLLIPRCSSSQSIKRHRGSLAHTFVLGFVVVRNPIRLSFALALFVGYSGRLLAKSGTSSHHILTRLRQP